MQFARSPLGRSQPPAITDLFAEEHTSRDRHDGTTSWKCALCLSIFNGPQAPSLFKTHLLKSYVLSSESPCPPNVQTICSHPLAISESPDTTLEQGPRGMPLSPQVDVHRVAPSGPPLPPPTSSFTKPETQLGIQVPTLGFFPTKASAFGLPPAVISSHAPPSSSHATAPSSSLSTSTAASLVTTAALMPDGSTGKTQLRYSTIKEFVCLVEECRGNPTARAFNLNGAKNHITGKCVGSWALANSEMLQVF